jgi:hypothetical protein
MQKTEPLIYVGPVVVLLSAGGIWLWFLAVDTFRIDTSGPAGSVTSLLGIAYLAGVPFACLVSVAFGVVGAARKRITWRIAALQVLLVAGVGLFWYWSLTSMRLK